MSLQYKEVDNFAILGNKLRIKKIAKKEINLVKVSHSYGDYFINGRMLLGRPEEKIFKN